MAYLNRCTRRTAWLGLWLLVLSACLPTLAQAVVRGSGATWVEVCTSTGMIRVSTADTAADGSSDPLPTAMTMAACDWCQWHAGATGVPPAQPTVLPGEAAPLAWVAQPAPGQGQAALWGRPQPRAPPAWL